MKNKKIILWTIVSLLSLTLLIFSLFQICVKYHPKENAIDSIAKHIAYDKVIHLEQFKDYTENSTVVLKYDFETRLKEETQLQKDILNSLSEDEFQILANEYYKASYDYVSSLVMTLFIIILIFSGCVFLVTALLAVKYADI